MAAGRAFDGTGRRVGGPPVDNGPRAQTGPGGSALVVAVLGLGLSVVPVSSHSGSLVDVVALVAGRARALGMRAPVHGDTTDRGRSGTAIGIGVAGSAARARAW